MQLLLLQGSNKITVEVDDGATVHDLKRATESATGIPVPNQKLIFGGKTLVDAFEVLREIKIKSGSKIMLIGSKLTEEDPKTEKELAKANAVASKLQGKVTSARKELEGIEQGYVPSEHTATQLRALEKKLLSLNEEGMRSLEALDAVTCTLVETKGSRKRIVRQIQESMDAAEKLVEKVKERKASTT